MTIHIEQKIYATNRKFAYAIKTFAPQEKKKRYLAGIYFFGFAKNYERRFTNIYSQYMQRKVKRYTTY
jgi:hypothetical protein